MNDQGNQAVLTVSGLHHHIASTQGDIQILKGVDLAMQQGQSVAILGESGSGKSTLLGLCAGLDVPSSGNITLAGHCLTHMSEDERANFRSKQCGFVFQAFHLLPELTALENVALPLELFGHADPKQTAADWLTQLGLAERSSHWPKQLSGGEQQRVALARAFAVNPSILFADEPTANLDQKTATHVIDHMFHQQQSQQNSMLLVTHDQSLAARCDQVYSLSEGKLHV